jgi:hypothetical protein
MVVDNESDTCNNGFMATTTYITVRTRTGQRVHAAAVGSSSTVCGHWLRRSAESMLIDHEVTCDRCLETLSRMSVEVRQSLTSTEPQVGDTFTEGDTTWTIRSVYADTVIAAAHGRTRRFTPEAVRVG